MIVSDPDSRLQFWRRAVQTAVMLLAGLFSTPAFAGGGPENVVVVVNRRSWASQTVANHFVQLRQIPPSNVIYMDWTGPLESIDVDTFREKIMRPVLEAAERLGIGGQIDYIVYSSDFPYAVGCQADFAGKKLPPWATLDASLTGVTYLGGYVMRKYPGYLWLESNYYMRKAGPSLEAGKGSTHGFRKDYGWGPDGDPTAAGGQNYVLSTMLAYTSGRGNSVREAIDYLHRAADADGTHPKGTIYFERNNGDPARSSPRHNGYSAVAEALKKLGVAAVVENGTVPMRCNDVQGAMVGVKDFDWAATGSTILPGAICDHLTSYGGALSTDSGQTPLTEFLRYGAAGASGTVAEPLAVAEKFPSPMMQLHYARGCSLAESFYQSVYGPYQLLIVGDPLCQPWANIPQVATTVVGGSKIKKTLIVIPKATVPGGGISRFEMYLDGQRIAMCTSDGALRFDATKVPDGYHELRVVAIAEGRIETQGRKIEGTVFDNAGHGAELTTKPEKVVRWGQALTLAANSPGAKGIAIYHNTRAVGQITGEQGQVEIDPKILGLGPVTLRALAFGEGSEVLAIARPVELTIVPPAALPPQVALPVVAYGNGLKVTLADKRSVICQDTSKRNWLEDAGVKPQEAYSVNGYFDVPAEDVYQFLARHAGPLKLSIDGVEQYQSANEPKTTQQFIPVSLAKGLHRLDIVGTSAGDVELELKFGGPGAYPVQGSRFKHIQ